ncbi:hypothetical protein [Phormidium sp. CCY1219]|uniref:hypothetical protein n=1 Tax=Phormidium sp. CCY1219 TaxID=2886104 RepID=UPI002D1F4985|nr:hypothetical protein [Phormidium sp. CCY1219]MEB3828203.1 hypothetical protein [Phormidium sp. CCY1219]
MAHSCQFHDRGGWEGSGAIASGVGAIAGRECAIALSGLSPSPITHYPYTTAFPG